MKTFSIDLAKCNKDGICAMDCPSGVIQMDSPEEIPHPSQDFEAYCLECGHCDKDYGFGAEDSALALSYLELYAPSIGLGSCWGGYFYSAVNAYPKTV